MSPEPCHCPTQEIALQKDCRRAGVLMESRIYQLCSGDCPPPSKPCTQEQSDAARIGWDEREKTRLASQPTLADKAVHLTQAMTRWIAAGMPRTPPDQLEERKRICQSNAGGCFDEKNVKCNHCGCGLVHEPILLGTIDRPGKWDMTSEACPRGLW